MANRPDVTSEVSRYYFFENWLINFKYPNLRISEPPSNKFYLAYFCQTQITCHTSLWDLSRIPTFQLYTELCWPFHFLDSNTHFQYFILGKLNELCRGICVVIQTTMLTDSRLLAISTGPSMAFYLDLILDKIWIKVGESWKNNFIRI